MVLTQVSGPSYHLANGPGPGTPIQSITASGKIKKEGYLLRMINVYNQWSQYHTIVVLSVRGGAQNYFRKKWREREIENRN